MGLENEAKKPVVGSHPAAVPTAQAATALKARPAPAPLPLPKPHTKTLDTTRVQYEDPDAPIRSTRVKKGIGPLKLALFAGALLFACGSVTLLIISKSAKRTPQGDLARAGDPQSPSTKHQVKSQANPFPPTRPTPATPPTSKPTNDLKADFIKSPPENRSEIPKPKLPEPVAPPATPGVATLILQLSDIDETVRLKAAKELGRLKENAKDAIPALKTASADQDEDVREVAKKSLAAIQAALGEEPAPVKPDRVQPDPFKVDAKLAPLIKDLRSKDNKLRLAAIAALEGMGEAAKPAGADIVEFGMMAINQNVKDAANAAMEKIDPKLHKEIVTILYDNDKSNRDRALETLSVLGTNAKASLPAIKWYHAHLLLEYRNAYAPSSTTTALVKIAPDDAGVQREVLKLVGSTDTMIILFDSIRRGSARSNIVKLMHELKIEDSQKLAPLLSGFVASEDPILIAEIGRLNVESKPKLAALGTALAKNTIPVATSVFIIQEVAKLGADAKAALPTLKSLKTHPEASIREAAANAVEKIKD